MHLFKSQLLQEPRPAPPPRRRPGVRSARRAPPPAAIEPRLLELEALHVLRVGCEQVALRAIDRAA